MYIQKLVLIADKGPKTVKIFINQPRTLDFDSAESMASVQTLEYVFTKLIRFFLEYNLLPNSSILGTCLGNPFRFVELLRAQGLYSKRTILMVLPDSTFPPNHQQHKNDKSANHLFPLS